MDRYGDEAMGELRPATVEELAALERVPASHRAPRRPISGRPLVIAVTTGSLLVSGAGAFALTRSGPNATMMQPYGADAPFGVGYVDGFGEHTPNPSGRPVSSASTTSRSSRPAGLESGAPVGLLPAPAVSLASAPAPSRSQDVVVSPSVPVVSVGDVTAVYWTMTWYGNYDTYVWVHNRGTADAAWEVRIKLPDGATVGTTMAAQKSYVDGTWIFKPSRGSLLPGGRVYLFAFSGQKPDGRFGLRSCTINAMACDPFS